jgi:hypothetical protein
VEPRLVKAHQLQRRSLASVETSVRGSKYQSGTARLRLRQKKEAQVGLPKVFCRALLYQVNCAPRRMWRAVCQRFGCPYMPFSTIPLFTFPFPLAAACAL